MTVWNDLGASIGKRPWILAVVLTAAVALWMGSGAFGPQRASEGSFATNANPSAPRVQVRSQTAQLITRYAQVYGRTAPARVVELAAETSGRVTAVTVQRGAKVRVGQVMIELDDRDRFARLAEASADVKRFATDFAGQKKLFDQGSYVSESDLAATEAALIRAQSELKRAQLDIEYMKIKAPFDGYLSDRTVEVGDYVRAGDSVATVVDNSKIVVEGSVPEQNAAKISSGDAAQASLVTGQIVSGRIRYVSPVADPATRTFAVELEVDNSAADLPAGITAEMRIPTGQVYAQRVSPALLSLDQAGNLGVKVVNDDGHVVFFRTEIAASDDSDVWVTGLPEVSDVIVVGQGFVKAGDPVEAVYASPETALAREEQP
jgi:multidrug efflux system membrane fusion protein